MGDELSSQNVLFLPLDYEGNQPLPRRQMTTLQTSEVRWYGYVKELCSAPATKKKKKREEMYIDLWKQVEGKSVNYLKAIY